MSLILDSGAFIALDRRDRAMWRRLEAALHDDVPIVTHGGVVGQVWRGGGPRQALLARVLAGVLVEPLDDDLGRRAGALLASTGHRDVVDAALALLADHGDVVFTSDPDDLVPLLAATGRHVEVVPV